MEFLWYIPNQVDPGHRLDDTVEDHNGLRRLTQLARSVEEHGWGGALIGTGWKRPDTFTVATALAAGTETFNPLIAIRPGYWEPAHFASSAATLDQLSGGRVKVNIVSGADHQAQYGDDEGDQAQRYARTREFMRLVRRLWTEDAITFEGEYYRATEASLEHRPVARPGRPHPQLYFGGASEAAQRTAAAEADVQLFWGEPLDGVEARIDRLRSLSAALDRDLPPLEFGLRITTLVRDTTEEAWADAQARVAAMAAGRDEWAADPGRRVAVGQQRLIDLAHQGDVLDDCLYTAPARVGGGGAGSTWLVGSADEVAKALRRYADLGVTHFVLSDTPYEREIARIGDSLLPLLGSA
ncbi:LLM class flavin-dependent oxidoreductase [Aeromicrobium duanguangcaii]|uniref:LLM class flavin-dependent oxidoreductase n=1 Tax=Aeromicrobium duanguangcaii TaxID=2968086 RepID=A0ABY5KC00_9ACTN|nr:LLM class flavin-dependent oxidoreductase [Aeromicrobium duanguangcaii]MCD9154771.1 LLM class flavin-dependent oxidoreductase [Aeromicrobium duanguangcaii]UUI67814.1 LLM class flavin-dependent oxidoreductase [Aeromicrobium duanguangcaii]